MFLNITRTKADAVFFGQAMENGFEPDIPWRLKPKGTLEWKVKELVLSADRYFLHGDNDEKFLELFSVFPSVERMAFLDVGHGEISVKKLREKSDILGLHCSYDGEKSKNVTITWHALPLLIR